MTESFYRKRPSYGAKPGVPSSHAPESLPPLKKKKEFVVTPEGEDYPRLVIPDYKKKSGMLTIAEGDEPIHVFNYTYPGGNFLCVGDRDNRETPSREVREAMKKLRPYLKGDEPLESGALITGWNLTPLPQPKQ